MSQAQRQPVTPAQRRCRPGGLGSVSDTDPLAAIRGANAQVPDGVRWSFRFWDGGRSTKYDRSCLSRRPLIQVMRVILPIMNTLSYEVSTQTGQGHDRSVCRGAVARCRTCPRAGTETVASGGPAGARRSASGPEDVVPGSAEDSDRASSTCLLYTSPSPRDRTR